MRNIYFISGLGADERVFRDIRISGASLHYIRWIEPLPGESIGEYARRLSSQITMQGENIAVGVSFGGIIAQELARYADFTKVIIVSSVKSSKEIPARYRFLGRTGILKLIPARLFSAYSKLLAYYFGTESPEEETLLKSIIRDTDGEFARWALQQLLTWQGSPIPASAILHLHGTADRLLPFSNIKGALAVPGGTHFMIVNKSELINEVLEREAGTA